MIIGSIVGNKSWSFATVAGRVVEDVAIGSMCMAGGATVNGLLAETGLVTNGNIYVTGISAILLACLAILRKSEIDSTLIRAVALWSGMVLTPIVGKVAQIAGPLLS